METTVIIDSNEQAHNLQLSFERRASLLTKILQEGLAIEHYIPDVTEKAELGTTSVYLSYRYFAHHISPLRNPIFRIKITGSITEELLSDCITQVVEQLKEFHIGKMPSAKANSDAQYLISTYTECAKFLSLIYQERLALEDYVPQISIRPDAKTGNTYFSVSYRHKYFLSRGEKDNFFEFESSIENPNLTL